MFLFLRVHVILTENVLFVSVFEFSNLLAKVVYGFSCTSCKQDVAVVCLLLHCSKINFFYKVTIY